MTNWFTTFRPVAHPRLRLFCFPYAGGNITVFRDWPAGLLPDVELWTVQLPGRGSRFREPLLTAMPPLVQTLAEVFPLDTPYALLGCSLGAALAFELARELERRYGSRPEHFFALACIAPHLRPEHPPRHTLPNDQLLTQLRQYNGIPQELLAHQEMLNLLLPILRADLTIYETYQYHPHFQLSCNLTAIGGLNDPLVSPQALAAWQPHTHYTFSHHLLPGDHFFIHPSRSALLTLINNGLSSSDSQVENGGFAASSSSAIRHSSFTRSYHAQRRI